MLQNFGVERRADLIHYAGNLNRNCPAFRRAVRSLEPVQSAAPSKAMCPLRANVVISSPFFPPRLRAAHQGRCLVIAASFYKFAALPDYAALRAPLLAECAT